jgi:hypothetical protein
MKIHPVGAIQCGLIDTQTDRLNEVNGRFSQFCECAQILLSANIMVLLVLNGCQNTYRLLPCTILTCLSNYRGAWGNVVVKALRY